MNDLHHVKQSGLQQLYLENGYKLRTTSYGEGHSYKDERKMLKVAAIQRALQGGPLSGEELRFFRYELHLSQAELGARLEVTDQTIAKWEKGLVQMKAKDALSIRILLLKALAPNTCVSELSEDAPADSRIVLRHGPNGWEAALRSNICNPAPLKDFATTLQGIRASTPKKRVDPSLLTIMFNHGNDDQSSEYQSHNGETIADAA